MNIFHDNLSWMINYFFNISTYFFKQIKDNLLLLVEQINYGTEG